MLKVESIERIVRNNGNIRNAEYLKQRNPSCPERNRKIGEAWTLSDSETAGKQHG